MNNEESNAKLRFIISGGGTGGHIFPAISIADALRRRYPNVKSFLWVLRDGWKWSVYPDPATRS